MPSNNLSYAQGAYQKKKETHSNVGFAEQLNAGRFLFDSAVFYTKIESSFILRVFWTPVILIFSSFNKKEKRQNIKAHQVCGTRAVAALGPSWK